MIFVIMIYYDVPFCPSLTSEYMVPAVGVLRIAPIFPSYVAEVSMHRLSSRVQCLTMGIY